VKEFGKGGAKRIPLIKDGHKTYDSFQKIVRENSRAKGRTGKKEKTQGES